MWMNSKKKGGDELEAPHLGTTKFIQKKFPIINLNKTMRKTCFAINHVFLERLSYAH